jgi:mannose-6-phosphate isomerase-like protein (cupin superfamily)
MNDSPLRVASDRERREEIQRAWAERGFSCELWVDPPETIWEDFVHDTDELVLLLDGQVTIEIAGRILRLDAGKEVMLPAGVRHTVRNVGGTSARWLYGYRLPGLTA